MADADGALPTASPVAYQAGGDERPPDSVGPEVELQGLTILTDGDRLFKRLGPTYRKYRDLPNVNPVIRREDRVKPYQLRSHPAINNGLLVQSRGRLMPEPCGPCAQGRGPFAECRGGIDEVNSAACGGCIWAHTGSFCTYYHGTRRGPRNKDGKESTPNGPSTIDMLAGTVPTDDRHQRTATPESLRGDTESQHNGVRKRKRESEVHPQLQQELEEAAQRQYQQQNWRPTPAPTQQPPLPPMPYSYPNTPNGPPPGPHLPGPPPGPLPPPGPRFYPPQQPPAPPPAPPPVPKTFQGTFFIHPRPVNEAMGAVPRDAALCKAPQSFFNVVQTIRNRIGDGPSTNGISAPPFAVTLTWPEAPRKIMIPWNDGDTFKQAMAYVNTLDLGAIDVYCTYKNASEQAASPDEAARRRSTGSRPGDGLAQPQQPSKPAQGSPG